ncbi:hypothetical protein C2845_PM13G08700 [Panicum miliaceum]|uniref:Uncharacterized protein n=1 Tax=Panicum miliaceum TaxID=4540 RepID=A0A3L6RHR2_PANMI|nr:hypothetical protein C2845_PM13G08700 [Panicum miliaceum]
MRGTRLLPIRTVGELAAGAFEGNNDNSLGMECPWSSDLSRKMARAGSRPGRSQAGNERWQGLVDLECGDEADI